MAVHNIDVARIFEDLAALLEIRGDNPFRVRAYRNAARVIEELPERVADIVVNGDRLLTVPGIGRDLAAKIAVIVETGSLPLLEELRREWPIRLEELAGIRGLGAGRIRVLFRELGITGAEDLRRAAREKRICGLKGFGEKTERLILEELERLRERQAAGLRILLVEAERIGEALLEHLRGARGIRDVMIAGSFRRRADTVGDLDILATVQRDADVMDRFAAWDRFERVLSRGLRKSSAVLRTGLQVDLRVFAPDEAGAALLYFTGAKAHNIAIRRLGLKRGLKINEYGVFRGEERVGGSTEEEIYALLGLPFIVPELREGRGEVEAALEKRLPRLVALDDIRGDLHVHSRDSDGRATIEEMAAAARARGLRYLAIADHSQKVTIARGLSPERLGRQMREIERLSRRLRGFTLLKSCEVDILEDGSLDMPDETLAELDVVVCSIHSRFRLPREAQTERILRAMDHPRCHILGHPTGRILNERPPYEVDMERVVRGAAERGCALEINSYPDRLDLNDEHCRLAKEAGGKVVISTDAHDTEGLGCLRFGVGQARRGWLEPGDVLNTLDWNELRTSLRRR